tara:strand:- start:45 stop:5384 length:5340 start_codon:yes stop_codon:yes gene_type:complete
MMGDRPASIVTGAGERRAYQGMPYYRYGPNYYDERGYTTGGYAGRGALPSMRPRRGTAPVPITKHELADEPEGGYYAPGVGGNVQMGEHQHHPETGETVLPWIPGSHRDMYGEDRGLQANPDYKPEPLTEEEERAKLVAELKYLTMWMLTLGSVGSLAVIGMTWDSMNHGLLRWLTLTFWKQFGWYYKRHPGERSVETSRLSPQTRAIGNPGWSRISDKDIIDEIGKMHDEADKLDAEEKKNRWKLEAEARERAIKFAKENPEIAKQQSIDFLKRLDKEPMFKFMTDRTKKGISPAEIASSKEFIDKLKEPYWETPEYRKVENHFKAEFDAWKEVKQATAQRPLRPIFGTYTPLQEAEEAFDNLIIEREKLNGFANDYYKGSKEIVNSKTEYSHNIKDLNRQFEENFNKGHKRLIMSWYREKYPNDSPQIKQWMDENGRLNISEKPRNNSWLIHADVTYPDGYKPIGNSNLVRYRGPVRPRHIVALHYNELVDLELDKRTFSSTDSHTGEMLISKEELAEDIKEQNKLRAEQKKIDDWTNRKFPTYEEMEAMTVEEYDKYQKRKSYAKPRTVLDGEIIGDKKPTPEAKYPRKIISGGQVGADQAGLSAGKKLGIETGGTAPPKYMTSEGGKLVPQPKLLQSYGLVEGEPDTTIWRKRTAANAKMSDGTVWFGNNTSRGYHLTKKRATEFNKHWIENPSPEELKRWATKNKIGVLNVAGNRTADVVATEKTIVDAFKTPEAKPKTLSMKFPYDNNQIDEFKDYKTTQEAIEAGKRTSTTRQMSWLKDYKVGDIIESSDGKGNKVLLIVEDIKEFNPKKMTEADWDAWSKREGWKKEWGKNYFKNKTGQGQLIFRLAESTPEAKPKNAFEAKVSRDAKLDILTDYEIQRRADEAELEELNRKVTAERAAQPKDIVPPFSEQRRQYFKEQARLSQEAWRGREWIRDRLPKQPLLSQPDWVITDEKIENLRRRKIEANRLAAKLPSTRAEDLLAFPETKISPDIDAPKVQEYQPNQYTRKLIDLYEKYTKDPGKWVTETSPAEVGETGGVQTQTRRWQPQPPGIRREPLMSLNQFEQAYGQDIRRLMESEDRRRLQDIQIEDGKPRAKQIPTSLFQAQADAEARRAYYDAALPESERIIADLEAKIGRRLPYLPFEERARLISEIMEPRSDAREWLDRRQRLLERTRMPKEAFPSPRSYGPFRPQHKIPPLGPFEWDRPLQSRSPDTPKHLWGKTAYNITQQEWIKQANEKQLLEWIEYEATKRGPKAATKTRRAIPASQYYGIDVDRFKKLIAEHKKANPNIRMDYVATLEQLKSERDLRQKDIDRIVELKEAQAQVNLEQKLVDAKDFKSLYYSDKNNLEQMGAGKKTYTLWNAQGSEGKWFDSDWQGIKRRGDAGEKLTGENLKRYNAYKEFWKPQSQLTRFNVWITHRTNLIARVDIPEAARGAPDPTSEMERWYYDLEDLSKEEKLRMFEKHHNARLTEIGMGHKIKPDEAKPKTQPKPKPTTPKPPTSTSVERVPRGGDVISRYPLRQTLPEPHTYDWPASKLEAFENLTGRERGRRPLPRFNVFTDEAPSLRQRATQRVARDLPKILPERLGGAPPEPVPRPYAGYGGEWGRRIAGSKAYQSAGVAWPYLERGILAPIAGGHAGGELIEGSPLEPYDRDLGPFKLSQAVGAGIGVAAPQYTFGAEIGQHYYGPAIAEHTGLSDEQAQWLGAGIGTASMAYPPMAAFTLTAPPAWWVGTEIGERANLGAYLGEKYYGETEEPEKMPKGEGYFGTPKQ